MAGETYLDLAGVLASFPENTANLIQPVDMRNATIALANDLGFQENLIAYPVAVTDAVFTSMYTPITIPLVIGQGWDTDGNNHFILDLLAGLTVPPGHQRMLGVTTEIFLEKIGGGTGAYDFQYFVGGAAVGRTVHILDVTAVPQTILIDEQFLYDYSVGDAIDLRVFGIGTSDDLTVEDLATRILGVLI